MSRSVEIQELALVVSIRNNNPTVLNLDILRYSGMIPADWELARAPIYTNEVVQLNFQNGISLISQSDRIAFIEPIKDKAAAEAQTPKILSNYLKMLPHAEYQALGINLRGYVPFETTEAASQYLSNNLLQSGSWQAFGQEAMQASVNLTYTVEGGRLQLNVSEATLQLPESEATPILLFGGNFVYGVTEEADRPAKLIERIGTWQTDLKTYQDLINDRFLNAEATGAKPELVGAGA